MNWDFAKLIKHLRRCVVTALLAYSDEGDSSAGLQERQGGRKKCGHERTVTEILVWIDLTEMYSEAGLIASLVSGFDFPLVFTSLLLSLSCISSSPTGGRVQT